MVHLSQKITVVLLIVGTLVSGCESRKQGASDRGTNLEQPAAKESIDALIERLAISQDAAADAPVYTPSVDTPGDDPRVNPYDAAEQLKAYGKEAFPRLLEMFDDDRQSVCFRRMIPCTVGLACFSIIEDEIFLLPDGYSGSFGRTGADGKMHDRPLFFAPKLFEMDTVAQWLAQREDRSLTELRIEALEWLVAEETKIGFQNEADRKDILDPLTRQLEILEGQK